MTGLSKSILLISIEFLIKFQRRLCFPIFKIFLHSKVMSYDSFFLKRHYDSHMTQTINNLHTKWFQILFLIQWCKKFGIRPRKIFQSIFFSRMRGRNQHSDLKFEFNVKLRVNWYLWNGVYNYLTDGSHENKNCVGVTRYIQ